MQVLITGGLGFIGTNLALALLKQGHYVTVLDNGWSTSNKPLSHPNYTHIDADVCDLRNSTLDGTFLQEEAGFQIYHLACPASPPAYMRDPVFTMDTCYIGTKAVLELARRRKCKVVFTSTSETYGDPLVHPQVEDYRGNVNQIGPRACYDEGKRLAETLCFEYRKLSVDARVVRLFNTYGPYMDPNDGRVISNFINQIQSGRKVTVYGSGKQTRSLCYVDDTVKALIEVMDLPVLEDAESLIPINIGNPHEQSLLEILQLIEGEMELKADIMHLPLPKDDPVRRCPDINRIQQLTGWYPSVNVLTGLRKTIHWFKNYA